MSRFINYPGDPDPGPDPSPESEQVCELLESAGVKQSIIEQVCKIVDALACKANAECPRCLDAAIEELCDQDTCSRCGAACGLGFDVCDKCHDAREGY
jgi:hypothetical protein